MQQSIKMILKPHMDKGYLSLHTFEMDTKRNTSEQFKLATADKARQLIEKLNPDVVIVSDDNASKYIVKPFYKDTDLPFVFCGVNWDASIYGYPYKNVTGMIEVDLSHILIKRLSRYAKGNRIGVLAVDNLSVRKNVKYQQSVHNIQYHKIYYVSDFNEWKKAYKRLQTEADILLLLNHPLKGWDNALAEQFILKETKIVTGNTLDWMTQFAVYSITKSAEEQGRWAAKAALSILKDHPPSSMPIVKNRTGETFINVKLAKRLGIEFNAELLKVVNVVGQE
ncbi:ABC transporter substrate binding protein [Candidatus Albibeggiatoa sp. nov. NOAA]|uniref:ABC transporter substrate-binding protein n=1 Tax=Candidatus Albibeggiatoa sp. nov. NOAA TaxID=3162724 RepID=UPI0032F802AB|nr:ABC transporter substrate-binding protein [Thiotrichaceae bacterium]